MGFSIGTSMEISAYISGEQVMGCFGNEYPEPTVDECPDCGTGVDEDGDSTQSCSHSPTECSTCGWAPCNESC
jgi:hypothetical protein